MSEISPSEKVLDETKKVSETVKIEAEILEIRNDIEIEKIAMLRHLIVSINLDEEKNGVIGSDPVYKNAFNEKEIGKIKAKIFKIIENL